MAKRSGGSGLGVGSKVSGLGLTLNPKPLSPKLLNPELLGFWKIWESWFHATQN